MKTVLLVLSCLLATTVNSQTFTNYTLEEIGIDNFLADLIVDDQNNFWVTSWVPGNTPGIASFDGTSWQTYTPSDGASALQYRGVMQSSTGDLYFGLYINNDGSNGFDIFDGTSWTNFRVSDGLVGGDVNDFAEAVNGDIWIATNSGLSRFNGSSFTNYTTEDGLPGNIVRGVITDDEGLTWIATNEGVSMFDGFTFTNFTEDDGLVENDIYGIHQDNDGFYWFGGFAFDTGVSRFDGTTFTTFSEVTNATRKIMSDNDGNIYFGGENGGVTIYDGENFTFITEEDGLLENHIRGIAIDGDDNIVFSTFEGVSVYSPTLGIITQDDSRLKTFPNPTENTINIENSSFEIRNYSIYNILGAQIVNQDVENIIESIDVSHLKAGIYLLQFTDGNNLQIVKRFVKR